MNLLQLNEQKLQNFKQNFKEKEKLQEKLQGHPLNIDIINTCA
jgi:hypothetical protein